MLNKQHKNFFCKKNIPNILLIIRIFFVPIIVTLLLMCYYKCSYDRCIYSINYIFLNEKIKCNFYLFFIISGVLFCIASFTDFLDGFIARKYNWVTDIGKIWDPIADKILINSIMICFAIDELIPPFLPIIMIARDIIVDGQRLFAIKKSIVIPANIFGKLKTILQIFSIISIFFLFNCGDYHNKWWWLIQNLGTFLALLMSIISGIIYTININKKNIWQ